MEAQLVAAHVVLHAIACTPAQLLDWLLGEESALFRRQELKALVGIHAETQQDGSGEAQAGCSWLATQTGLVGTAGIHGQPQQDGLVREGLGSVG